MLAQLSKLKMQVALSESDIGTVKVGQKATVTINAASGEQVAAHVSAISVLSSSSSSGSSAVSYPVTVLLDQTTEGVRTGMSATADIITARGLLISKREPGVQSELTRLPNWYLLLISPSVIASQRRSGVVRM